MTLLPKIEEILLLAIWKLRENAYGTSIIEQVENDTGLPWVSGSVYSALARLKKNGYVTAVRTESGSERKGRPRIYYELTVSGKKNLASAQKVSRLMWDGVPDFEEGLP